RGLGGPVTCLRLISVVAAVCLAAGCSSGGSTTPDGTATPLPLDPVFELSGSALSTGEALVGADPVALRGWELLGDDGALLRLHLMAGTAECFGAEVDVEESESEVRVDVRVGTLESMASADCVAVAGASHVDVELASPIDDRDVID